MTNAAQQMFRDADKVQHKPLRDDQWAEGVECYQRAKVMTDAVSDLVKAFAEQTGKKADAIRRVLKARANSKESEMRDELQGTLELLGGSNESE